MTKPYDIVGNTHDDDAVLDDIASDTMGWKTLMAVLRSLERQGLIDSADRIRPRELPTHFRALLTS